ncbi:cupin domain-containing protein [Pedobacter sp. HMF7647]|uniref:Cupin domain-containing protein n=1 Tax=Hufsiella arboris TaxID=2695275 RepID=A0A7K1Y6R6_9SPHI|nr:cupin domain-containing protein [Hufsiella arboris]MXV50130.1 cupin domain-containing protein [Hufsiella arboris]
MKHVAITISLIFLCLIAGALRSIGQTAIFPKGSKAPASNFTGTVWFAPLVSNDSTFNCTIGTVTFEPGSRSNWHRHPSGQILLITDGTGYTQERGRPIRVIRKGDVVKCSPNVEHWHGASKENAMTHIAVNPNTEKGLVEWLQPVTDNEYKAAYNQSKQ